MKKTWLYTLTGWVILMFLFSFSMDTRLYSQEEKKSEDIADISLDELLNIEITTAGKKAEKISDIPASIVLVTREDIERLGYQSLEEILENVPGLYKIDDMSYYGASFGVRGFFSPAQRNIVFMVNGVKQTDGYWKVAFLDNFRIPVEAIDRIEVVRGPMSVVYGSGAFFGAINIITNQNAEGKDLNIVAASAGSMDTIRSSVRFSGKEGNFNYAFSAGYYDTNGPNEPLSKMSTMDNSWAGIGDTNNSTEKRLEEQNKYFNLSSDYKGLYAKMSFSESKKENYIVFPSVSDGTLTNANFTTVAFGFKKDLSSKWNLDASLTFRKHTWFIDWDILDPSLYGYEYGKSLEFEADLTALYKASDKFSITADLNYTRTSDINWLDVLPSIGFNVNYIQPDGIKNPSFFMQMDYAPSKTFRFVGGVRLEKMDKYTLQALDFTSLGPVPDEIIEGIYNNDKTRLIPRFAAIVSINEKNYLKLLYGRAIRHPEFQPNLENIRFAAPSLDPEYIDTLELHYITSPTENVTLNFSLFYNKLKNLIARTFTVLDDGTLITYYGNGGELETYGSELSLRTKIKSFDFEVSGTYQKTKDKSEGMADIDVAYSPKLIAHVKASYKFGQSVILGFTGRYVDKMFPKWDISTESRIGLEVPSHFIADANLRIENLFKSGFGKGLFLNARCTNLSNYDYLYPTNENNNFWADKGVIGRGLSRMFTVTIGKKF